VAETMGLLGKWFLHLNKSGYQNNMDMNRIAQTQDSALDLLAYFPALCKKAREQKAGRFLVSKGLSLNNFTAFFEIVLIWGGIIYY
jgi:hypothetical protein